MTSAFTSEVFGGRRQGPRVDSLLGKVIIDAAVDADGDTLTLTLQGDAYDDPNYGRNPRPTQTVTFSPPGTSGQGPTGQQSMGGGMGNVSRTEIYRGNVDPRDNEQAIALTGASISLGDRFYVNCGHPTTATDRRSAEDAPWMAVEGDRWRAIDASAAGAAPNSTNSLRFALPDPRTTAHSAGTVLVWGWLMRQSDNTPMIAFSNTIYGKALPLVIQREDITPVTTVDPDTGGTLTDRSVAFRHFEDAVKARFPDYFLRLAVDAVGYTCAGMVATSHMGLVVENDIPHTPGQVALHPGASLPLVFDRTRWGATTDAIYNRVLAFSSWESGAEYRSLVGAGGSRVEAFAWELIPALDAANNGWLILGTIEPESQDVEQALVSIPYGGHTLDLVYQTTGRVAWKAGNVVLVEHTIAIAVGDRRQFMGIVQRHSSDETYRVGICIGAGAFVYSTYAARADLARTAAIGVGNDWAPALTRQFRGQLADFGVLHTEDMVLHPPSPNWMAAALPADRALPYGTALTISAGSSASRYQYQPGDNLLPAPQRVETGGNGGLSIAPGPSGVNRDETAAIHIRLRSLASGARYDYRVPMAQFGIRNTLGSRYTYTANDHAELTFYQGLSGQCQGGPTGQGWNAVRATLYEDDRAGVASHLCLARWALTDAIAIDCTAVRIEPRQE